MKKKCANCTNCHDSYKGGFCAVKKKPVKKSAVGCENWKGGKK